MLVRIVTKDSNAVMIVTVMMLVRIASKDDSNAGKDS